MPTHTVSFLTEFYQVKFSSLCCALIACFTAIFHLIYPSYFSCDIFFLTFRLYHCVENTREYHEAEPQFIEIEAEHAEVVENLIQAYPSYLSLEMLQTKDLEIIQTLWENKLIVTRNPLDGDQYD